MLGTRRARAHYYLPPSPGCSFYCSSRIPRTWGKRRTSFDADAGVLIPHCQSRHASTIFPSAFRRGLKPFPTLPQSVPLPDQQLSPPDVARLCESRSPHFSARDELPYVRMHYGLVFTLSVKASPLPGLPAELLVASFERRCPAREHRVPTSFLGRRPACAEA